MNEISNIDQIELRSEEVNDILTQMPQGIIRWGNQLFLALLVLLLLVSWFVKYPDIITSQAVLTTEIPPQKEFAKTSGKLEELLVQNGQEVQKNQVLGVIENTAKYEDVLKLKKIIDTITVNYNDFYFPIDNLPTLFLGDLESDFAGFQNSYLQYQLNKKLQPYSNEMVAGKYNVAELTNQLQNLENQKEINAKEMVLKKNELNRQKILYDKGVIAAQDYEYKELEYLQSERNYKSMIGTISQLKNAVVAAKSNTKGTEISKTKEEVQLLKNVIQSYNQLKKNLKEWELNYVFKSNMSGKVSFLNVWNQNQTVQVGEMIFTIIPIGHSQFVAKLKTPMLNSGKIKVGQEVNVKLNNYPETEFGMLKGKVKSISLTPDKEGFYVVDVSIPNKLVTTYNKKISFQQEMTGTAEIITEDLRLIQRFFYQFVKIIKR